MVSLEAQTTREPEQSGRLEDVVGAEHVRAEGGLLAADPVRGNRRQVHDGVGTGEALDGLAEFGELDGEGGRELLDRWDEVDAEHLVVVLEQVADDRTAGLPARAGDDDLHRRNHKASVRR